MKNLFLISFFLLLNIYIVFSQENLDINKKREYEISVIDRPQKVELIEYLNGQYSEM